MPLTYQVRENDIVESRLDLEQSIINNLSVFFDIFTQKLIYEIKLVTKITTQDGREILAGSHKVTTVVPHKTLANPEAEKRYQYLKANNLLSITANDPKVETRYQYLYNTNQLPKEFKGTELQIKNQYLISQGQTLTVQTKTKTIINKFAVMDIYILLPGQARKKITRLVLAPVNILQYNPTIYDLQTQSNSVGILIAAGAKAPAPQPQTPPPPVVTPTTVTPPKTPPPPQPFIPPKPTPIPPPKKLTTDWSTVYKVKDTYLNEKAEILGYESEVRTGNPPGWARGSVTAIPLVSETLNGVFVPTSLKHASGLSGVPEELILQLLRSAGSTFGSGTTPVVSSLVTPSAKPGANATTLFEWYQAQGQTRPPVWIRGKIYEGFGLGPEGTYIGTAEQNIKLLAKLKMQ